jgi:predicted PurR-regulated permease PerM
MADQPGESPGVATARRTFFVLGSLGLVVAALYLGQRIFVPLALAVLLTLVLGPVVIWLERHRFGRFPAVLSTAVLAFVLIGLAGWAVAAQLANLLADFPEHVAVVRGKLTHANGGPGPLRTIKKLLAEVEKAGSPDEPVPAGGPLIRVEPAKPSLFTQLQPVLGGVLGAVSIALVVLLLVVVLLLYREDTRNRLIRLAGRSRLTVTTRALDEAGRRIGGYLLGQATVNAGFGAMVTLGLLALGIPYPFLGGILAAAFRFIPAVGIWLVAPLPAVLGFTTGTAHPATVLGLFLALDLLTTYGVEPKVCGKSVGLAPVPLFLAITFWTGLWGVVGLVLATPVTVSLAVLGRHVRPLRFLAVLLGKEAALRPAARYYQRLLARDRFEAEAVVKEYLAAHPVESLFDRVLIPALVLVRRGRRAGELRPEDEEFILRATQDFVRGIEASTGAATDPDRADGAVVLGVPAADAAEVAALLMLRCLARPAGTEVLVPEAGTAPGTEPTTSALPRVLLIAAVGPGGLTEARYLCRRLRSQQPGATIVAGRWGLGRDPKKARAQLLAAGADRMVATLREARAYLERLAHLHHPLPAPEVATPVA